MVDSLAGKKSAGQVLLLRRASGGRQRARHHEKAVSEDDKLSLSRSVTHLIGLHCAVVPLSRPLCSVQLGR